MDVAAQTPASDGQAGAGSPARPRGGRRDLRRRHRGGRAGTPDGDKGLGGRGACEEQGKGIGRIRLRRIDDASAGSLHAFLAEAVEPGSQVHTDGWEGYAGLKAKGYQHRVTVLRARKGSPAELLPRVHLVASLLKRWLLGTHQGAVSFAYLDYYLDEFTFRFNRRTSKSRGKLFYRLLQQAMAVEPVPYKSLVEQAGAALVDDHDM